MARRSYYDVYTDYLIAYTAIVGSVSLAALGLFIASLFVIKQRKDPARRGFAWLKAALLLFFLDGILVTIVQIINILLTYDVITLFVRTNQYWELTSRLNSWASFLSHLASAALLLSLVDVALGVLYCLGRLPAARRMVQWLAYGFAFMEVVFALTRLIKYETFFTEYYKALDKRGPLNDFPDVSVLRPYQLLESAGRILFCVAFVAQLGLSTVVLVAVRREVEHRRTAVLLLIAGIFAFIGSLYVLVMTAIFSIPEHPSSGELYLSALSAIFGFVFPFVALNVLFAAGVRKIGGLWSTPYDNFTPPDQYDYTQGGQTMALGIEQPGMRDAYTPYIVR